MNQKTAPTAEGEARGLAARLPDLIAEAEHAAQIVTAGRHPRRRAGRSDTFWQFRDYAHGDPIASIDWRQSARLEQRLLVRQTEWEQPQTFLLWCQGDEDFAYGSKGLPTKEHRGRVIALALAILALRTGERVGVLGHGEPPRSGLHQLAGMARHLLKSPADLSRAELREGATAILVSDFHGDLSRFAPLLERVRAARGKVILVAVEDPSEILFPFEGALRFEGTGGARRKQFGEAAAVRDAYLKTRADHYDQLHALTTRARERLFRHRTDEPLPPLLLALSEAIEGERR